MEKVCGEGGAEGRVGIVTVPECTRHPGTVGVLTGDSHLTPLEGFRGHTTETRSHSHRRGFPEGPRSCANQVPHRGAPGPSVAESRRL